MKLANITRPPYARGKCHKPNLPFALAGLLAPICPHMPSPGSEDSTRCPVNLGDLKPLGVKSRFARPSFLIQANTVPEGFSAIVGLCRQNS